MRLIRNKQTIALAMLSGAMLLCGGPAGCGKLQSAQSLVTDAKQYRQKGDNKAAIIQLKNALQKNPDDHEARYLLGSIYNDTGDPQSAEKEIRKAISLGMASTTALPGLSKALLMQGQYQKVLDETQAAGTTASADILVSRGDAFQALGRHREAKESYELARKDNADRPDALIGLAKNALAENDIETAKRLAEQAVAKNPTHVEAWLFKGELARAEGKTDVALAAFDRVLQLKPDSAPAHIAKANLEIKSGKFDAAKADIDAARKSGQNRLHVFYTQAVLDYKQGKYAAALESLQQILRVAPDHMPSVLLAGAVQYALGSTQQAEQYLKAYLEKNPNDLYARKLLASTLLKNGEAQHAIGVLTPAAGAAPQDAHLLVLTGESYLQARDFAKATEYFEKASALAPQDAMIHTALGKSRLEQGDNAHAITELETAASLDKKSTQAGVMLVMTHIRLHNYDAALAAVKTLEKDHPQDPLVQNLKGGVYLAKKDISAARASFQQALALQPTYFPAAASLAQLDVLEKKPDAAKKRFEELLAKDSKNVQVLTALAGLAVSQGKSGEAIVWLERASNDNPDAMQPAKMLVALYAGSGQKQKALTFARKMQVTKPDNPEVLEMLAQAQLANDDKSAALDTYTKLATVLPTSPQVQMRIAALQMVMRNPSAASEALKKALALQPDYLDAQQAQAGLEAGKGNYTQALAIARTVQQQREKSPVGFVMEGDVLMMQKKPELAAKAYERAMAAQRTGGLMIKMHGALRQAGKEKEADTRLTQWIDAHPDDMPVRGYLATTQLMSGQNKQAIKNFQVILQKDPKNVGMLNNLAWAYQQEKDPHALEYAERAYQLNTKSPAVLDTLGWILVEQGNIARGLPLLQQAVALAPDAPELRYHLALGLVKSGDKVKARSELEQLANVKNFSHGQDVKALLARL